MEVLNLKATLGLDSSGYESGLASAATQAEGFGSTLDGIMSNASKLFTDILLRVGNAAVGFIEDSIKTGMQFDKSISQLAATLGVSVDEIQELRTYAIQMGESTAFTATQAAEALNYMALAGYDAEKSMRMLPTVLNLAAAGNMELGYASDIVTDIQSALGLTVEETAEMVDQMAMTASKSNTSVSQLGEAMLRVGATARFMNGGTEEIAQVFGILADNGIKGAEAGTHLRNMILSLSAPTKGAQEALEKLGVSIFDDEGNVRSFAEFFPDLKAAMDQLGSDAERLELLDMLFNRRDIASATALMNTPVERWAELYGYVEGAEGAAQKMAETQLDNLMGDITLFNSKLDATKLTISDALEPTLRMIVQRGTEGLGLFTESLQDYLASEKGVEMMERLMNAVDRIIDTLTSADTIDSLLNLITGAVESITSGIEWISEHSDEILAFLENAGTILAGMFAGDKINSLLQGLGIGSIGQLTGKLFGGGGSSGATPIVKGTPLTGGSGGSGTGAAAAAPSTAAVAAKGKAFASAISTSAALGPTIGISAGMVGGYLLDKSYTEETWGAFSEMADSAKETSAIARNGTERMRELGVVFDTLSEGLMDIHGEITMGNEEAQWAYDYITENYDALKEYVDFEAAGWNAEGYAKAIQEGHWGGISEDVGIAVSNIMLQLQEAIEQGAAGITGATEENIGDGLSEDVESGLTEGGQAGADAMQGSLEAAGSSAAESIAASIQSSLNGLTLPSLLIGGVLGYMKTQGHATAAGSGEILHGMAPIGIDARGVMHYGGETQDEAVVGVNSLNHMIQKSVAGAFAAIQGTKTTQPVTVQLVLDTGVLLGEVDVGLNEIATWRGGGRA